MSKFALELTDDIADYIVAEILSLHFKMIKKDVDELFKKELTEEYQQLDLAHNIRYLEAFKIVLEYFGKYDET